MSNFSIELKRCSKPVMMFVHDWKSIWAN